MCGIAGIVRLGLSPVIRPNELDRMAETLAHRGPDDQGIYIDPSAGLCGLAHRRLAVIDPAGGAQPLSDEDTGLAITYNGECYNFRQLRSELAAAGYRFRTNCDTEVVLQLYRRYGSDCVDHMRGMFAFAIWDGKRRELFLARDRMGQKPLYYAVYKGRFIFASECKAILQINGFPHVPNTSAILKYLMLQYVPCPASAFEGILVLPPAHSLIIRAEAETPPSQPKRYWSILPIPQFSGSFAKAAERVRVELAEATRLRMVSDVPLGAFLSGGLDSTIIVGLMSQASARPVVSCSVGFGERLYNELDYARLAAERFGCDHREYITTADCRDTIERLSYFYDEPFADFSAVPTYQLCCAARDQVTVALSGDGSDECFGGYDRYYAIELAERLGRSRILSWLARSGLWRLLTADEHHSGSHRLRRLLDAVGLPADKRYLAWMAVFDPAMLEKLLAEDTVLQGDSTESLWRYFEDYFDKNAIGGSDKYKGCAMLADGNMYLPEDINRKVDRASMAFGLEVRSPFQDHKLVELAYSLPVDYRRRGRLGKRILRSAFGDMLPSKILRRKKMGFGIPVGTWFRVELRDMFIDTVLSDRSIQRGYFSRAAIERLLAENDRRQYDHGHRLWSLLMLELWHRRYIDSG